MPWKIGSCGLPLGLGTRQSDLNAYAWAAAPIESMRDAPKLGWDLAPLTERLARYEAGQTWHGDLLTF